MKDVTLSELTALVKTLYKENVKSEPVIELDDGLMAIQSGYSLNTTLYTGEKQPIRTKLSETFTHAGDYVRFVKEYMGDGSKVFYNDSAVRVVFNYPAKDRPDHEDSTATLALERTADQKLLITAISGKQKFKQRDFVKVLKQLEHCITSHDGLTLFSIMENLKALKDVNSISKNTEHGISINVKVESGLKNIAVPERIRVQIPLYKAMPHKLTTFELECFYEFNDDDGFNVELACWDFDKSLEDATRELVENVVADIGIPAYQAHLQ